jgi:hypothetical protein
MNELLRSLLESLEAVGKEHPELFDSDVRHAMSNAIVDGFVRGHGVEAVPTGFGMFSVEADAKVHQAIEAYVVSACRLASEIGIKRFQDRLAAVQNSEVRTCCGSDYDDFLGHSAAEQFDSVGNVIGMQ